MIFECAKIDFLPVRYSTFAPVNTFRKTLILLLCLRLLLSGDTVAELFKLPALVGHYLHHCHAEDHTGVFGFLAEHYGSHDHHDQDSSDHQAHHRLPFSGHHSDGMKEPVQPFLTVLDLKYPLINLSALPENPLVCLVKTWNSQFSSTFWQPPKLA